MKRMIAILLVILVCASFCILSAGAEPVGGYYSCGDVNWDRSFDSVDVTLTQRFLAGLVEFNEVYDQPMADFDHDWEVSVIDVTWMQRSLAQMSVPEGIGGFAEMYIPLRSLSASYDSGKVKVGIPVTFTAEMADDAAYQFAFYLNGELFQPLSVKNSVTLTFDEAKSYYIQVKVYNWQGFSKEQNIYRYLVTPGAPSDKLSFKSIRWRDNPGTSWDLKLITEATGGTAPYTYSLKIYHLNKESYYAESMRDSDVEAFNQYAVYHSVDAWQWKTDEYDRLYLYRDFSEATETEWNMSMLEFGEQYMIEVQAQDANGNLTTVHSIRLDNYILVD